MAAPTDELPTTTSTSDESTPWLTPREAADRAKCGLKLIYSNVRGGKLRAVRLGARNDIRIHRTWVDAWMTAATIVNPDAPGDDILPTAIAFKKRR